MAEVRWRGSAAAEPGLGGQRPGMRIRCNQTTAGKIVPAKSVQSDTTATACCFSQENECVPPGSVKSAEPLDIGSFQYLSAARPRSALL